MDFNVTAGYRGYVSIYDNLPGSNASLSEESKSTAFVEQFKSLYGQIGAPRSLNDYGIRRSDIPRITQLTLTQRMNNLEMNPMPFGEADVTALLEKVIA